MTSIGLKLHGVARPWRHVLIAALAGLALIGVLTGQLPLHNDSVYPGDRSSLAASAQHAFDEMAAQRRLGWHAAIAVTDVDPRVVTVLLLDRNGAPLRIDAVVGALHRAGTASADRAVSFTPAGPSLWRAALGNLSRGEWDLRIEVVRPDGQNYRTEWHLQIRNGAES